MNPDRIRELSSVYRIRPLLFSKMAGALCLVSVSCCVLLTVNLHGQAWTQAKGQSYIKMFYGNITSAEQYTFDGRTTDYVQGLPGDTYKDRSLYLYSEVGVSDNLTLVVALPYKRTFVRDQAFRFRVFGLGTATVGGRMSLLPLFGVESSRNAVGVNLTAFVPMGYTRNYTPSTGTGQVDLQTSVFYGRSFYPFPAYLQFGSGYRIRSSQYFLSAATECRSGSDIHCISDVKPDFGNELVWHAETGISPFGGALFLQVLTTGTWSIAKPTVGFSANNPLPTHQRYAKAGVGGTIYPFRIIKSETLSSLGISMQYFTTPYGRNTINSRDVFVGLEFQPHF